MKSTANFAFTRDQLIYIVELAFVASLDRIDSGMPTACTTWDDRVRMGENWDSAVIETAGMHIACLYASLTNDGIGIGDALQVSGFGTAVEEWIETAWKDEGKAVRQRMKQLGSGGWKIEQAYTNYPDCYAHAIKYVDAMFGDYLLTT